MNETSAIKETSGEVSDQLDLLDVIADRVEKLVEKLDNATAPIRNPNKASPEPAVAPPEEPLCELAAKIRGSRGRITNAFNHIVRLIEELEV